jgi:hypothetical protein
MHLSIRLMDEIIPVNLFSVVHLVESNYSPEKYDLLEHVPGKQNIVADTLSRSPEFDPDMKVIETRILKEEKGKLVLSQQAKIAMVQVSDNDKELLEEIKQKTKGEEAGEYDFRKMNGFIMIPKSMEEK